MKQSQGPEGPKHTDAELGGGISSGEALGPESAVREVGWIDRGVCSSLTPEGVVECWQSAKSGELRMC
jgi:hypothetical protein